MNYHHLNHEERDRLAVLRSQGKTLREISHSLGRSPGTLSRELRRNESLSRTGGYFPRAAHRLAQRRLRLSHWTPRINHTALRQEIWQMLENGWSPELISGRLHRLRPDLPSVCPETIYQWIYTERRDLIPCLARSHRKRRCRKYHRKNRLHIPARKSIRERPAIIEDRSQPGHWETDLVVGQGRQALQVLVERQSRYTLLMKIPNKGSGPSRVALTRLMDTIPAHLRRTITYDNGPENVEHQTLNEDFGLESFFCEPYHSWEKGTVENTNGLIRRFIPKSTKLETIPGHQIVQIEQWLNNRPRKVLQFRTPREAFEALLVALAG
jgi:IS30 family transposase